MNYNAIQTTHLSDKEYPTSLTEIYDPPDMLYVRGTLSKQRMVAVVGSRKHSSYGEQVTKEIVQALVQCNITVVSGLAFGIDAIAHRETLAQKGSTIAVLGSGIDDRTISPKAHLSLAQNILSSGGAIISELSEGTPAARYTFPRRNRIIAGLVELIIVTEAREKSGALITAQYGLDHAIEIATLPHPITSVTGKGCNQLIQQGANLLTNIPDLLSLLQIQPYPIAQTLPLYIPTNNTEQKLLSLLSKAPIHIDILVRTSTLPSSQVVSTMSLLELKGIVQHIGNMKYIRLR